MINFDDLAEDIVDSCIPGPFVITKIVCDHTNNSEEDSKNNVINVDIWIPYSSSNRNYNQFYCKTNTRII